DGVVRVWDRARESELAALPAGNVVALAFLQGDKMLACHTTTGNVSLWQIDKASKYGDYPGPATKVVAAAFTTDGLVAASAQEDGVVKVWELESGKERGALRGHRGAVNAITFSPDGETVATAGADATVQLWTQNGNPRIQLAEHTDAVTSVAF